MLGGWVAVAAFAALVLLADWLARRRRSPRTVLLVSAVTGLAVSALGAVIVRLRTAGDLSSPRGIAVMSGAGLAVGLLVGAAFAGLGHAIQTPGPPAPAGGGGSPDTERHPRI